MATGRSRNAIEFQDVVASTFVVGNDLISSDFLSIQDAYNNLPDPGGKIFVKDPLAITAPIQIGDKDVSIEFAGGATLMPFGDIEVFSFLDGMTQKRQTRFDNLKISGDPTKTQTLLALKDQNSLMDLLLVNPFIQGCRVFLDLQDGDVSFTQVEKVVVIGGYIEPPTGDGTSVLFKGAAYPSFSRGGVSVFFQDCSVFSYPNYFAHGWHFDADGDLNFQSCELHIVGACKITGFGWKSGVVNSVTHDGTDSITFANGNSFNEAGVNNCLLQDATFILDDEMQITDVKMLGTAKIVCQGTYGHKQTLKGVFQSGNNPFSGSPVAAIDILAGNKVEIVGCDLSLGTAALIRNASATGPIISACRFNAPGAVKTIEDTGAGDFTTIEGCVGLTTGGGLSLASGSSVAGAAIYNKSAASTAALVEAVPTITNPKGLQGVGTIKNSGGVNSIDVKESFADAFGTSSTLTTPVTPGNSLPLNLGINIGTGFPPYVSYKVEVIDTVAGNHSTYVANFTAQGVI